jgi:hypothetical protein
MQCISQPATASKSVVRNDTHIRVLNTLIPVINRPHSRKPDHTFPALSACRLCCLPVAPVGNWYHAGYHLATTIATPAAYAPLPWAFAMLTWPGGIIAFVIGTAVTWYNRYAAWTHTSHDTCCQPDCELHAELSQAVTCYGNLDCCCSSADITAPVWLPAGVWS